MKCQSEHGCRTAPVRSTLGTKLATLLISASITLALAVLVVPFPALAQLANCSLTGTVYDSSGAEVPGAKVVLKDRASGATRTVTANGSGFFTFQFLLPGTYDATVSKQGFKSWQQKGVTLNNGESRELPGIKLQLGEMSQTVTVETGVEAIAPISSGASSTTLNNEIVSKTAIQGRDAAELIRFMPGMAINNGLNNTEWNSLTTKSNTGPIGAFSANGTAPNGGMQMVMNGSVIVDAGNQGTQVANVNQDQTQEVQIQNAAFDAEYAHGPAVFNAIGKRGSAQFHGEGYVYTRNGSLNAEDALLKSKGVKKPIDHYWYPGFTFGGPVLIPGTDFNKSRNRVNFFVAFEDMKQNPVGNLHQWVVPTGANLTGDFSQVGTKFAGLWPASDVPSGTCMGKTSGGQSTGTSYTISGGIVPAACVDPNGLALLNLMTKSPGVQYLSNATGYNAQFLDNPPTNRYDLNLRGDVDIIPNKLSAWASYTRQPETDLNNISVWWWPNGSLPYPTGMPAHQLSKAYSFGATSILSPTLTNQATFGYAYFINPISLGNPDAVNPAKVGYNVNLPYQQIVPQIPNIVSWCCGGAGGDQPTTANAAGFLAPGFGTNWYSNGDFGKYSATPSFTDNVTKVLGSHTLMAGFFMSSYSNVQTEGYSVGLNGQWEFDPWCNGSTGNIFADILTGQGACSFTQPNTIPVDNVRYHEVAFFGQDAWQATHRLTIHFGVRFDHEGQWYPSNQNNGIAVWQANQYNATANGLTGFTWHGLSSSVPVSGFGTQAFYPDPRIGVAYDLFGDGKTVLRGGFGIYRFQVAYNDVTENNLLDGPLGVLNYTSNCKFTSFNDLTANPACVAPGTSSLNTTPAGRAGITQGGILAGDNRAPYTQNWDVIVEHQMPWRALLSLEYMGSRSRNLLITQNGAGGVGLAGINYVPQGALFNADPVTGITYFCQGTPSSTCDPGQPPSSAIPDYRPYDYSQIPVFRHGSYSNYNAFMVTFQKQSGPAVFNLNYTYSKALGIRDGNNDNGQGSGAALNAFCLACNYGTLAFNRSSIFNAIYVFNLPSPIHGNAFLKQAVNGWVLSGATQIQTGPPLQPLTGGRLNAGFGNIPYGTTTDCSVKGATCNPVTNESILGTDGIQLVPYLVCNPSKNLAPGQYFNPNCFAAPTTRGQNGPLVWPNITGPGFFTSDLGVYKDFKAGERNTIEFRFTAFDFLNHANGQFGLTNDINLSFTDPATNNVTQSPTSGCSYSGSGANYPNCTDGYPHYEQGRRVMELSLKYIF